MIRLLNMLIVTALPLAAAAQTTGSQVPAAAQAAPAAPAPTSHRYPVDSLSIDTLAQDPATRPLLEKHFPSLLAHPSYEMIKGMSLQAIMPYSQGGITEEKIKALQADLDTLPAAK